jgi:uncharacterized phage protein gp47/JayE
MTYVPRTYEDVVRDLLTTLTGGTVRETLTAPADTDTLVVEKLRNRPVRRVSHLTGKVAASPEPDAPQLDYRFTPADFELVSTNGNPDEKDAIRFRDGARRPVPGTRLTVNYYPVQTGPLPVTDLNVGSVARTLMETFARELAVTYLHLQHIYDSAFLDTAEGSSLDKVVALVGVQRLAAGYPVVTVRFSRAEGVGGRITIPAGTPLVDAEGTRYLTLTALTLEPNETAREVQARGETAGAKLVQQGALDRVEVSIAGISGVVNTEPARALSAPETDDELRRRAPGALHGVVRGTLDALRFGLLSIPGVKDVALTEEPNGVPGELRIEVAYVDDDDEEAQAAVEAAIQALKPAGIRVGARGAARRTVDVRVTLTLAGAGVAGAELDALNAGVEQRLHAYLTAVPPGGEVRRAQLTSLALQDARIVDAQVVLREGGTETDSLSLAQGEVLGVGRVEFDTPATERPAATPPTTATVSAILPVHLAPGITLQNVRSAIDAALDSHLRTRGIDAPLTVDGIAAAIRDDSRFALVRNAVQVTVENGTFFQLADNLGSYRPQAGEVLQRGQVDVDVRETVSS